LLHNTFRSGVGLSNINSLPSRLCNMLALHDGKSNATVEAVRVEHIRVVETWKVRMSWMHDESPTSKGATNGYTRICNCLPAYQVT
jgi:hypothetical protein